MASDSTHADLTLDAQAVREPYATGFTYTTSTTEEPTDPVTSYQYAAAESQPVAPETPGGRYEYSIASVDTASDEYINVRYPGLADATSPSFQRTAEPFASATAEGAALDSRPSDSAYDQSMLSPVASSVDGIGVDTYRRRVAPTSLAVGDPGDGAHLMGRLLPFVFAGGADPRGRSLDAAEPSILGGLSAGDGVVLFVGGVGRLSEQSTQPAVYEHVFVDPFARLGFLPERLGIFAPTTPIGEISTGTPRRVYGGSARVEIELDVQTVSGRSHTGRSLRADVASVSGHTIGTHRLDTLVAALLDTSIPIPSHPLAVTSGVAASRSIGDDVYEAGRHLGLAIDSDAPSREYEDGLALAMAIGPTAEDEIYPFAQALGDGIGLDPGDDVYRGAELSPEAFSVVTVTNDTYVLAYEEGDVYVLYPLFRRLSGDFDADEVWVKPGVKLGDDVVWTGHGSPGGLSL